MNALVASIIRTLVPHIVTQVASLFLMINIHVPDDMRLQLSAVVGFVLFAIYYGGVRVLEQQWPSLGILLGLPSSPDTYSKGNDTPAEAAKQTSIAATSVIPATGTGWQGDGHGVTQDSVFPKAAVDAAQAAQAEPAVEVPAPAEVTPVFTPPVA